VTHFTDDPDKIPLKYRNKARQLDLAPAPGEKEQPAAQRQRQPVVETVPADGKAQSLYGGHNESWWRASLKTLRDQMKTIQENLPAKQEKLIALSRKRTLYHKASDRTAYNDLKAEIENDEARLQEAQKQLADLNAEADKSGVPFGWRQ
jgi:DNA repair exonuclease SbcCD ATPase subunit